MLLRAREEADDADDAAPVVGVVGAGDAVGRVVAALDRAAAARRDDAFLRAAAAHEAEAERRAGGAPLADDDRPRRPGLPPGARGGGSSRGAAAGPRGGIAPLAAPPPPRPASPSPAELARRAEARLAASLRARPGARALLSGEWGRGGGGGGRGRGGEGEGGGGWAATTPEALARRVADRYRASAATAAAAGRPGDPDAVKRALLAVARWCDARRDDDAACPSAAEAALLSAPAEAAREARAAALAAALAAEGNEIARAGGVGGAEPTADPADRDSTALAAALRRVAALAAAPAGATTPSWHADAVGVFARAGLGPRLKALRQPLDVRAATTGPAAGSGPDMKSAAVVEAARRAVDAWRSVGRTAAGAGTKT